MVRAERGLGLGFVLGIGCSGGSSYSPLDPKFPPIFLFQFSLSVARYRVFKHFYSEGKFNQKADVFFVSFFFLFLFFLKLNVLTTKEIYLFSFALLL